MLTLLLVALALLLAAFGLGAIFMLKNMLLCASLFMGALVTIYAAINDYRNKDRVRLLSSLATGRREDLRAKPMELE